MQHLQDYQDLSNDFADVKSRITIEQAAAWYSSETNKKPKKSGGSYRFGTKGSIEISEKDGFVVWYDHEREKGGSIIDLVIDVANCDKATALKVCCDEILNMPNEVRCAKWTQDYASLCDDMKRYIVTFEILSAMSCDLECPEFANLWADLGELEDKILRGFDALDEIEED